MLVDGFSLWGYVDLMEKCMKRFVLALILVLVPVFAVAQGPVSEVRGGLYSHDVDFISFNREEGVDLNAEVLFESPDILQVLWAPRPHVGASVNTAGDTSFYYGGFTWEWDFLEDYFVDANFGGALHDGSNLTDDSDRKSMGSDVLFRLGAALGYRLDEHYNISLQFEHYSNAGTGAANEGLDNVGLRIGYRF